MKNKVIFLILSIFMFMSYVKADELTENQRAVVNNAKAYFNRGAYIQYDEPTLTYLHKNYIVRDQERFEPEDAISSYNKYTVCDNFAFLVYYNTFVNNSNKNYVINDRDVKYAGVSKWRKESYYYLGFSYQSIANSSSPYYNKDIVVLKIENPSTNPVIEKINGVEYEKRVYDEEKMLQSKQKIIDTLQPGDIIAYSRKADKDSTPDNLYFKKTNTASGHVMLYAGEYDGKRMAYHAGNGGVYNFSTKKDVVETSKGTILYSDLDDYMNVASNGRKTFLHQRIGTIVIIRPLNEVTSKGYKLNSNSKARLNYPDLIVEKTATRSRYDTVGIGQTITYTIKLKNNGKSAYSNINVSASVPDNTTYVSSDPKYVSRTDDKVNWSVNLNAGATETITYTVRIKDDTSLVGKYITSNNDYVGGIKLNEINTLIGNPLSTKSVSNLQTNIQDLKDKTYNTTEEFINEVYNSKYVKIGNIDSIINKYFTSKIVDITKMESSPITSDYFHGNKDTGNQTIYNLKKNLSVKDMYINGLYGGIYTVEENSSEFNELIRARYLKTADLRFGDILIINDPDEKRMYLCGNGSDKSFSLMTVQNNKVVMSGYDSSVAKLQSLIGQNNFIVIRPSLIMNDEIELINNSNNNLKSLEIDLADIKFNKDVTTYKVRADKSVKSILIYAELEDTSATFVDGFGPRNANIVDGENKILVKTKAKNGNEKVYTIIVDKIDNKSSDASLKKLSINIGDIKFNSSTYEYKVIINEDINDITIDAVANDPKASIKIEKPKSLEFGNNEYKIIVTAENGNKKTYRINVYKTDPNSEEKPEVIIKSSNANLSNIIISGVRINFDKDKKTYDVYTSSDKLDIKVEKEDNKSYVQIIGNNNLKNGNVVTIGVVAEDGTRNEYKLNIIKSDNIDYINLSISIAMILLTFIVFIITINKSKNKKQLKK